MYTYIYKFIYIYMCMRALVHSYIHTCTKHTNKHFFKALQWCLYLLQTEWKSATSPEDTKVQSNIYYWWGGSSSSPWLADSSRAHKGINWLIRISAYLWGHQLIDRVINRVWRSLLIMEYQLIIGIWARWFNTLVNSLTRVLNNW